MRISNHISPFKALTVLACAALATRADGRQSPRLDRILPRDDCGLEGNPDLYGLGIRIGFYCQLIATCFANTFIPSETRSTQTVNLWFQFSLFVGLIFQATQEDFYAIESYLVVILLSGVICTTFSYFFICLAIAGARKSGLFGIFGGAVFTMICFLILLLALYIYSAWFWWKGIDNMLANPCTTYGFFLSKVNIFHWFRTLNKFFNIWMMAAFALAIICFIAVMIMISLDNPQLLFARGKDENFFLYYLDILLGPFDEPEWSKNGEFLKKWRTENQGSSGLRNRASAGNSSASSNDGHPISGAAFREASKHRPSETLFWYIAGSIFGFGGVAIIILAVECCLKWNQVTNVNDLNSVGQLIPLVVGAGTLLQIFKNIYVRVRENWKKLKKGTRSFRALFVDFLAPEGDDTSQIELDPITTPSPTHSTGSITSTHT